MHTQEHWFTFKFTHSHEQRQDKFVFTALIRQQPVRLKDVMGLSWFCLNPLVLSHAVRIRRNVPLQILVKMYYLAWFVDVLQFGIV